MAERTRVWVLIERTYQLNEAHDRIGNWWCEFTLFGSMDSAIGELQRHRKLLEAKVDEDGEPRGWEIGDCWATHVYAINSSELLEKELEILPREVVP